MKESGKQIEINGDYQARPILQGEWFYDQIKPMPVQIFALNYDYYFNLDEGYNEKDLEPQLNCQREQYVVVWHADNFFSGVDFPSNGFMNLQAAREYAESVVKQIHWKEPLTADFI